tara:strand:+ start:13456 stop:13650 length:195 start_codon:yes stop_codon:yes gene_type:complete
MTKKQIKTVSEALVVIKDLQLICKRQRDEITHLKKTVEIESSKRFKKNDLDKKIESFLGGFGNV